MKEFSVRKCAYCGREFIPQRYNAIYCNEPHYMTCPVCGRVYEVKNKDKLKFPPTACSYACRKVLRERTSLERYGITAPGNNPEARKRAREASLKHYGTEHPMKNHQVRDSQIQSLLANHGVSNPGQIKSKIKQYKESVWVAEADCKLLVLHKEYADRFLNRNDPHKTSKYHELCLGYVYQDKIIQVMTFGRSQVEGFEYQLFRACASKYRVTNGLSSLLQVAINQFELEKLCCRKADLTLPLEDNLPQYVHLL